MELKRADLDEFYELINTAETLLEILDNLNEGKTNNGNYVILKNAKVKIKKADKKYAEIYSKLKN